MLVEIIHAEDSHVEVRSELGQFHAQWRGAVPPVGAKRDVELGFDERFVWGGDAVPVEGQPHAIAGGEKDIVMVASVEQLGDGGFVGLRLGPSIVMVQADGDPPPVGTTVRFEASLGVTLFDTGYV